MAGKKTSGLEEKTEAGVEAGEAKEPLHILHLQKDGALDPSLVPGRAQSHASLLAVLATSAGNALEWYDFALFGFMAPELSELFFPPADPTVALLETFVVFGGAFLVRPLGGYFVGNFSDKYGRKAALQMSVAAMGIATTLLGVLPTFDNVGPLATFLLVLCRIVQGLSVGGQLTNALVFLVESAPDGHQHLLGAIGFASGSVGTMFGALAVSVAKEQFSHEALINHGWRLPFLASALLGVAGYYIQSWAEESPEFNKSSAVPTGSKAGGKVEGEEVGRAGLSSMVESVQQHGPKFVAVAGVCALSPAAFYTYFIYAPAFLTAVARRKIFGAAFMTTIMLAISALLMPLFGHLTDRRSWGQGSQSGADARERADHALWFLYRGAAILGLLSPVSFWALTSGSYTLASLGMLIATVGLSMFNGALAAWLVRSFEPQSRGAVLGVAWNVVAAIVGGLTPALATFVVEKTGSELAPGIYVSVMSALAVMSLSSLESAQ